jgi:FeS assembly SUF system regulator
MLRMSKLTDYATVVLSHLSDAEGSLHTATDIAARTGLGLPTVSKLLKAMTRADIVTSVRGPQGGYRLARSPRDISAADVIDALEGPVAITACSSTEVGCDLEPVCRVGSAWQRINLAIRVALRDVSLAQLTEGPESAPVHIDLVEQLGLRAHGRDPQELSGAD